MATPLEQALHNLSYHRPTDDVQEKMAFLRESAKDYAVDIWAMCSDPAMGRELQMAFRALEDSLMYAIAGLARHSAKEE